MTRTFAAAMRRANRLTPARLNIATRSIQTAMTELMVSAAMAPLSAMTPVQTLAAPKKIKRRTPKPKIKLAKIPKRKAGQTLSNVVSALRQTRALMPQVTPNTPKPGIGTIPKGAQFLSRRHRSAAGTRGYRLYIPAAFASAAKPPAGLIVMLHGCNQTPEDFATGTHMNTLADTHGLVIAYPEQTRASNPVSCWNWFTPGNQRRGLGEPAILASLARKLTREFGLKRDGVFVAGLSAGGAMAVILADAYPDVFAAAGVHSGLARGAAQDMLSAMSAMRSGAAGTAMPARTGKAAAAPRLIIFQGDADRTVHPSNAGMILAAALGPDATPASSDTRTIKDRTYLREDFAGPDGKTQVESWLIRGTGHAWSGGRAAGSYTDRHGPDASGQMVRFFLNKPA